MPAARLVGTRRALRGRHVIAAWGLAAELPQVPLADAPERGYIELSGVQPRHRRSVYENRDIVVLDDDVDDDGPEPGWHRVGTFDPERGAWINGPPRWPGG